MAKLVDAPGLDPDARKGVGVRVPFLVPWLYRLRVYVYHEAATGFMRKT